MDKAAILSLRYPEFGESLQTAGYRVIDSERISCFIDYEQDHADMQCLIVEDTAFILKGCERLAEELKDEYRIIFCGEHLSGKYPANVPLNVCVIGKTLIGRPDSIDENVLSFCRERGYQMINVRQGYAKCSCAVVSDHALITEDNGIYYSLKESKVDILKIREGRVALSGNTHGFIGGASGYRDHKIYFTGNIKLHPDCAMIEEFCRKHHTEIISLSERQLTDIGGILFC